MIRERYYSLGEYVHQFDHANLDMDIDVGHNVKSEATILARKQGVRIKWKGDLKVLILPAAIWEKAIDAVINEKRETEGT